LRVREMPCGGGADYGIGSVCEIAADVSAGADQ